MEYSSYKQKIKKINELARNTVVYLSIDINKSLGEEAYSYLRLGLAYDGTCGPEAADGSWVVFGVGCTGD